MSAIVPNATLFLSVALLTARLLAVHAADAPAPSKTPPASSSKTRNAGPEIPITKIRGRVVCLPEEVHRLHDTDLPTRHDHIWALRVASGELLTILPGRYAEAIFEDERIRAKELQLRVRQFPKAGAIEVLTVRSVRNGVVLDLYYYCDVCAIKSVSPEICACCQAPVELVEKPLSGETD